MDYIDNGTSVFMKCIENGTPMFDGQDGLKYDIWSTTMIFFYMHMGMMCWYYSVVIGYNTSKKPNNTTKKELKRKRKNPWISS
jgi:hypothetical protein